MYISSQTEIIVECRQYMESTSPIMYLIETHLPCKGICIKVGIQCDNKLYRSYVLEILDVNGIGLIKYLLTYTDRKYQCMHKNKRT